MAYVERIGPWILSSAEARGIPHFYVAWALRVMADTLDPPEDER